MNLGVALSLQVVVGIYVFLNLLVGLLDFEQEVVRGVLFNVVETQRSVDVDEWILVFVTREDVLGWGNIEVVVESVAGCLPTEGKDVLWRG